ncbi:unnamed protein product [Heterobilharzia americana]|nr:unnamed protein product [Heterobilharzia americana]
MSHTSIIYKNVNKVELKKRISLNIILDQSILPVCYSGELITGCVVLETKDVLCVQILQIELLGRAVVVAPKNLTLSKGCTKGWTKERKSLQENFTSYEGVGCIVSGINGPVDPEVLQDRLKCKSMKGFDKLMPAFQTVNEEIYCSVNSILIGGAVSGNCELVLAGKRYYPFEFELPEVCPCSFVGSRGSVEYRLRVYLLLSNGDQLCVDRGLRVIRKMTVNKTMLIPGTLACPPISRNYMSSFDEFTSTGSKVMFTNISKKQSKLSRVFKNDTESILNEYDNSDQQLIEKSSLLTSTYASEYITDRLSSFLPSAYSNVDLNDTTKLMKYPMGSCLNGSPQDDTQHRMTENKEIFSVKSLCKLPSDLTKKARNVLLNSSHKTTLTLQRCSDNPFPLPSSWLSRPCGLGYGTYPRTCFGAQTGYPISCRLTVSQRQLFPGSRLTACLNLLIEDPFALLLAPSLNNNSYDLNWCAKFSTKTKSYKKDLWSPLARAFVSYYLEDRMRQTFNDEGKEVNELCWSGFNKQLHRIFLILRQVITYRDWTNRVIAQEERDIYRGEMQKRQTSEKHVLRVILEHSFQIPPLPPTSLEGCSCIDVAYSLGLVSFKLKRLKTSLKSTKWILDNNIKSVIPDKSIEFIYMHETYGKGVGTYEALSKKPQVITFQQSKHGKKKDFRRFSHVHHDLLLPIPIVIGTTNTNHKDGRIAGSYELFEAPNKSNPLIGSVFYMQWPNSYQMGSLPPIYQCMREHSEIYQDGSIQTINPTELLNLSQMRSLNGTIQSNVSNNTDSQDLKQFTDNEDDDHNFETFFQINKKRTSSKQAETASRKTNSSSFSVNQTIIGKERSI